MASAVLASFSVRSAANAAAFHPSWSLWPGVSRSVASLVSRAAWQALWRADSSWRRFSSVMARTSVGSIGGNDPEGEHEALRPFTRESRPCRVPVGDAWLMSSRSTDAAAPSNFGQDSWGRTRPASRATGEAGLCLMGRGGASNSPRQSERRARRDAVPKYRIRLSGSSPHVSRSTSSGSRRQGGDRGATVGHRGIA